MNNQKPFSPRALALAKAQGSDARYEGKDRDDDQPYHCEDLATAWDEGWERADDERKLEADTY